MNIPSFPHFAPIQVGKKRLRHPPRAVLIVSTLRIGDVLLTTPLARTLKQAWPDVAIDFVVLPGTQGALEGNPDVRHVHAFAQRTGLRGKLSQLATIWRKYDLAFATQASDRTRLFAMAASPITLGFVTQESAAGFKQRLLDQAIPFDDRNTHTVSLNLLLSSALGLHPVPQVVNPSASALPLLLEQLQSDLQPYVVLHPSPKFRYKMWRDLAWSELGIWLKSLGLRVVLTASPDPEERAYVDAIARDIGHGCQSLAGQLSLAQTAQLLRKARLYVGPDTAVTHMAAASGVSTIALFGPSNPVKWGPWPHDWTQTRSPWAMTGSANQGNVWLLQGQGDCVPCMLEGCDKNESSESRCLQQLPLARVQAAARQALAITSEPVPVSVQRNAAFNKSA